jgi:hypothetical protein
METKCYLRKQNLIKEEIKKKKNLESRIKNAEAFGYFGSKQN